MREARERWGGESILPYSYGGSNGLLTQDTSDATLFRRLGASRLARTVCAAATGAANMAMYGKMPSVTYQDFPEARLIVLWGVNPSASGIHLVPYIREAQRRGAMLIVVDPRTTPLARQADIHLAVRPGTDLPVALSIHRYLFEEGHADAGVPRRRTRAAPSSCARERAAWTFERAAAEAGVAGRRAAPRGGALRRDESPALIRCGWGQERNRNGGNASLAILALPAVAGKFGVRGGGYTMSNTASWGITTPGFASRRTADPHRQHEPAGPRAARVHRPAGQVLFVYNSNPAVTSPDQRRVLRGLEREDLFTVVFDQVMTDTARYADVLLPNTTFLEGYDLVRATARRPAARQAGRSSRSASRAPTPTCSAS